MKWAVIVQIGSFVVPSLLLLAGAALFQYIQNGYLDMRQLYGLMPLKMRLPFDENTLFGFCAVFTCNYVFVTVAVAACLVTNVIILNMGLFFNTIREHFELMLQNMNELVGVYRTPDYKVRLKSNLIEAINFHNQVKDVFKVAERVMSGSVFCQLFFGILFLSNISFGLEMSMKTMDSNVSHQVCSAVMSAGNLFMFCSVGSFTTDNFLRFADVSYESKWYQFPDDLKKYLVLIIADGQRPRVFQGLGIFDLNLYTYTQVMKTVGRFYLMFKSFIK